MNDNNALAIVESEPLPSALATLSVTRDPERVLAEAQKAAVALKRVVDGKEKPVRFNGETYLEFEDWQTLARFYGVTARIRSTEVVRLEDVQGFIATADAIDVSTGQVLSSADSMCMNDEPNWSRKPLFQLRSMAQTRACAKALRNVFSWVVVLAGYKPTPAEEMDGVVAAAPAPVQMPQAAPAPRPVAAPQPAPAPVATGQPLTVKAARVLKTGKNAKGEPWTLYLIQTVEGGEGTTFSQTIYEDALNAMELDEKVLITFEENNGKRSVKSLTAAGEAA